MGAAYGTDLAILYAVDAVLYFKPKKEVSTVFCMDKTQSVSAIFKKLFDLGFLRQCKCCLKCPAYFLYFLIWNFRY